MRNSLNFKDWMMLLEMSFTEADIPEHFVVGCIFSEDFVKHYPFTPKDAVCSLVGLEGIGEKGSNIAYSTAESQGCALIMPGKALVKCNKISRILYENPHYQASAGHRTPRRTKLGSDPLNSGGVKAHSTESLVQSTISNTLDSASGHVRRVGIKNLEEYLTSQKSGNPDLKALKLGVDCCRVFSNISDSLIEKIDDKMPQNDINDVVRELIADLHSGGNFRTLSKDYLTSDKFMKIFKKLKPIKGNLFKGYEVPEYKVWGSRAFVTPGPISLITGRNIKPHRTRHQEKHLKSIESVDDFARRMMAVFRVTLGENVARTLADADTDVQHAYIVKNTEDNMYWAKGGKWIAATGGRIPEDAHLWWNKEAAEKAATRYRGWHSPQGLPPDGYIRSIQVIEIDKPVSSIVKWIGNYSKSLGDYQTEKEWVMKRQHLPGMIVKRCPSCKKYNTIEDKEEKEITCWNCKAKFDVTEGAGVAERPVLNVPKGSSLYVRTVAYLPDWADKYIPDDMKKSPLIDKYKYLFEKFNLYKKFNLHVVTSGSYNSVRDQMNKFDTVQSRPYDPNRAETLQNIKEAIMKGINKVNMLEKWLIYNNNNKINTVKHTKSELMDKIGKEIRMKQPDISQEDYDNQVEQEAMEQIQDVLKNKSPKFGNLSKSDILAIDEMTEKEIKDSGDAVGYSLHIVLDRWKKAGIIRVDDSGRITVLDLDIDEDALAVYDYIRNEEGVTADDIAVHTSVEGEDLQKALASLIGKEKIQLLANGEYDIKLSDKEMKNINDIERNILKVVEDKNMLDGHDVVAEIGGDFKDIKWAIRVLILKGLIFKSPFSGYYRLTTPKNKPFSDDEKRVLAHLKQWPNSDLFSIKKSVVKISDSEITKVLDKLLARGLVTINGEEVILNKSEVSDFKSDAKDYSKAADAIINTLTKHFFTGSNEVATLKKWDKYETESYMDFLESKGIIVDLVIPTSYQKRKIPANSSFNPDAQTWEEGYVLKLADKLNYFDPEKVMNVLQKKISSWQSTHALLAWMAEKKKTLKSFYHPIKRKTCYHAINKNPKIDVSKWENEVVEFLTARNAPQTEEAIQDNVTNLSEKAMKYVLDKMIGDLEPKIKKQKDFTNIEMYYLSTGEPPKPAEDYYDVVKNILAKDGPMTSTVLHDKIHTIVPDLNYSQIDVLLNLMGDFNNDTMDYGENGVIKNTYSGFMSISLFHLPDQALPGAEDYAEKFFVAIKEKPKTLRELRVMFGMNSTTVSKVLNVLLSPSDDTPKIVKSIDFNGDEVYHTPDTDPLAEQREGVEKEIKSILKSEGGFKKVSDVANTMYNNNSIGYSVSNKIIIDMIKAGKIYLKEGDTDSSTESMFRKYAVISLNPIDPSQVVKNPELVLAGNYIKEFLESLAKSGKSSSLYGLQELIKYNKNVVANMAEAKTILDMLLQQGKIYITKASEDYWQQQVTWEGIDLNKFAEEKLKKSEEKIVEFLKMNKTISGLTLHKLASVILDEFAYSYNKVREFFDKLIAKGVMHISTPLPYPDQYWTQEAALGSATPMGSVSPVE